MQKKTQLLNFVVPLLTLLAVVGTTLVGRPASVLAASPKPSEYFYIVSALDGSRYIDIQNAQTDPGTAGIPIITHKKNYPATDNQLWQLKDNGDGYSYIQSKSKTKKGDILVLDIKGGQTNPGNNGIPVIAFTKNSSSASKNQLWKFVSDKLNGGDYGYFESKSNLVIDISRSNTTVDTPLIAFPRDKLISPNQIWIKVPQFFT